jgi:phenylpyruvate tautomerase PptA (4-oxalocrotonate tautomerase family)
MIADGIHQALVKAINVPLADRFQLISEYGAEQFIYDSIYLDIARTDQLVIIQVTMNVGRDITQKRALYRSIVDHLSTHPGLRPEDVFINLVEVAQENWSFGRGIAQYAPE